MHSIFFPLDVENPLSRLSCYSCIWSFKLVISKGCFTPEISYMTTRCHCVSPNVRFQNNVPAFSLVQSLQLLFFFRTRTKTACLCCEGPHQTAAKAQSGHDADSVQTSQKVGISAQKRRSSLGEREGWRAAQVWDVRGAGPLAQGHTDPGSQLSHAVCCLWNAGKLTSLSPSSS